MPSDLDMKQEVQQWLDSTKFPNLAVDTSLISTVSAKILSRLSRNFTTSTWVDGNGHLQQASTPSLVWKAAGMKIAAWIYDRAYSETTTEGEPLWGEHLEEMACGILDGIEDGSISMVDYAAGQPTLPGNEKPGETPDSPNFFPSDATNGSPVYDSMGYVRAEQGSEDVQFYVGMRF